MIFTYLIEQWQQVLNHYFIAGFIIGILMLILLNVGEEEEDSVDTRLTSWEVILTILFWPAIVVLFLSKLFGKKD